MLYLTSLASKTLVNLLEFLPHSPAKMSVAFIPTAGDLYADKPWMEADRQRLVELGFQVTDVDAKNYSRDELSNKDIIFVAGGTTTYLAEKARESGFDKLVKELVMNGTIYVGASAGSVWAGPDIEIDRVFDHRNLGHDLKSYAGLGLVDFVVVPHADNIKYAAIINDINEKFGKKLNLRQLNDNQALLINDGEVKLLEAQK